MACIGRCTPAVPREVENLGRGLGGGLTCQRENFQTVFFSACPNPLVIATIVPHYYSRHVKLSGIVHRIFSNEYTVHTNFCDAKVTEKCTCTVTPKKKTS